MTELHQALKDLDWAVQFLRLLQASKIGSVTVESYDHLFIAEHIARRFSKNECAVCTVTKWNNVKP